MIEFDGGGDGCKYRQLSTWKSPFPYMPAMVYGSIGCSNKLWNYINMDDSVE